MFLFPSTTHVFYIPQKLQNYNGQCCCGHRGNSEYEIVYEELSITFNECSVFTFIIIIKPITKFGFCFLNAGNLTTYKCICTIADAICFNNTNSETASITKVMPFKFSFN